MDAQLLQVPQSAENRSAKALSAKIGVDMKFRHGNTVDLITKLPNLNGFNIALSSEIARNKRFNDHFSIIQVNIDDFSRINSEFGRDQGDLIIKNLAFRLKQSLREVDILARTGGDEFMVILPKTNACDGLIVSHKLHNELNKATFKVELNNLTVTASFGVATFPLHGTCIDSIKQAAHLVLLQAKSSGKNCVACHEINVRCKSLDRKPKVANIRHAITENRIEVALQPIVSSNQMSVFAYEALARVRENGTLLTAADFIEEAEAYGVVKEIDSRVLGLGLSALKELAPDTKMFFNFSPASFADISWMKGLPNKIKMAGIDYQRVVIEITEREALPQLDATEAIINELRTYGIQFALDDFGSGFSSFIYLRHLPVDYIKIDGSFISDLRWNEYDRIIVAGIQKIAQEFGLKTIAEFVEDEATAGLLHEIGVDFAQGYYFTLDQPA